MKVQSETKQGAELLYKTANTAHQKRALAGCLED